jgi:hypothetical protein
MVEGVSEAPGRMPGRGGDQVTAPGTDEARVWGGRALIEVEVGL